MKKRLRLLLKDESGATSVLIIFMMIVLVTLGALAISSANVNIKFSKKAMSWNETYYALDAKGQEFIKDITSALQQADEKAVMYICDEGFLLPSYEGLPEGVQQTIADEYNNIIDKNTFVLSALKIVYFYYALENINTLSSAYSDCYISPLSDGDLISGIVVEKLFTDEDFHLTVKLNVLPVKYEITYSEDDIQGTRDFSEGYFAIKEWRQWHTSKDYGEELDLWEGFEF